MASKTEARSNRRLPVCSLLSLLNLVIAVACEEAGRDLVEADGLAGAVNSSMPAPVALITNADGPAVTSEIELIFSSIVVESRFKEVLSSIIEGELTDDQRDRVDRPYRYLDETEVYTEEAWSRRGPNGTVVRGYRVWREKNASPLAELKVSQGDAPEINEGVLAAVEDATAQDSLIPLMLQLRGLPEWNVPLAPLATVLSPLDVQVQAARREEAMAEREALYDDLAEAVIADVEKIGGKASTRLWKTGWLSVTIPPAAFSALAQDERLARIDSDRDKDLQVHSDWFLGHGRQAKYMGMDSFLAAGFDGEQPNPRRHRYGDIVVGMTEPNGYESGACAFREGPGCTSASRIIDTYACDFTGATPCVSGSVVDRNVNEGHGTATTSVVLGDYTDGQANGKRLGDTSWTSDSCSFNSQCASNICEGGRCAHSSAWENERTGMAPEARAILYGWFNATTFGSGSSSFAAMFESAVADKVDITSSSWGWWDSRSCDLRALTAYEQAMEVAYDDGILLVASAGNQNGDDATSCQLGEPADLPKVLTINAYDAGTTDCVNTPTTRCLLDKNSCPGGKGCSARGGGSITVAGKGLQANAVSGVDLVAPNDIIGATGSTSGSDGMPSGLPGSGGFVGTSAAAPQVAGAAALVKSQYLSSGQTWVNSPGRLHTLMLSMGDRHRSTNPASGTTWTTQLTTTPDPWYGLGRLRMRLFAGTALSPWANSFVTRVWSSPGKYTYKPFGSGLLLGGVNLVKCVAYQPEDMSGKSNVAETKLTVRLLANCTGAPVATRVSDNFDLKKIAVFQGVNFTSTCVEVEIEAEGVTSQGATLHVSCHYSGVADDASS